MTAVFWSTPEPMWLYLTQHDGFLWNAIWGLKGQVHSTELSCLALHVLWFIWIPWIFSQYCVVLGERPKFFCLVFYLVKDQISLPFCLFQNVFFFYLFDTSLMKCGTKWWVMIQLCLRRLRCCIIPKHDTLTYFQFSCLLWTVSKQYKVDIL